MRLGATKKDDQPPDRLFDQPILTGHQAGKHLERNDFENLLALYYKMRNWDENGMPPQDIERRFDDLPTSE